MASPRLAGGSVGDVLAVDLDRARGRVLQPGDQAQQRGFAAARGADEDDELAVLDVRSMPGMTSTSPKDLRTFFECDLAHDSLQVCYFTAPKVRPRTSCFWLNQPMIRIGAMAMPMPPRASPRTGPAAAENAGDEGRQRRRLVVVRTDGPERLVPGEDDVQQQVEAMPGTAIGVSTCTISLPERAPSIRAASRISPGISLK
jgi:hypothetical protein